MDISTNIESVLNDLNSGIKYWKKDYPTPFLGDPYNYEGVKPVEATKAYMTLIADLIVVAGLKVPDNELSRLEKNISKFISAFFDTLFEQKTGEQVEQFATICKERQKDLLKVSNFIITNNLKEAFDAMFIVSGSPDNPFCTRLLDANKRYVSDTLNQIMVYFVEEDLLLADVTISKRPRFYIYLYKVLFHILEIVSSYKDDSLDQQAVEALLLLPSSIGQLYEKLNPTDDIMDRYAKDLLDTLQQPSTGPSEAFWEIFEEVQKDLDFGKSNPRKAKPYIKEFVKACNSLKWSKFDSHQYYSTLKSSTYSIEIEEQYGKKKSYKFPSFVSSLFEPDEAKGLEEVQEFDNFINYNSGYLSRAESLIKFGFDVTGYRAITKMIWNPSKYKPRAIHLCCQADQDRLGNIHNNLSKFLDSLKSDAKEDHYNKGVKFLMKVTDPHFRSVNRNSVFVSDFSNATDTLDQSFQNRCLGLIAPPPVVKYWESISKMPKVFILKNGKKIFYTQESGQPQGSLVLLTHSL
jgi:hypothetical protein